MAVAPYSPVPLLAAALIAGVGYWPASHVWPGTPFMALWKTAGVGLLALWAAFRARGVSAWLLVVVLACGAMGDALLDVAGETAGALTFLAGHLIAVVLYRRERGRGGAFVGTGIAVLVPIAAFAISGRAAVALYATGLGAMAGTAWGSRFPRRSVALGALLFVASDLLIFARAGPLAGSILPAVLIWPLYFAAQVSIAIGVSRTLEGERR